MDPRRLDYLQTLGITAYVARRESVAPDAPVPPADLPAPGAAPLPAGIAMPSTVHATGPVASLDWPALAARVRDCTRCALAATRTQTVFGVGSRNAPLLVVGEAPGADEDAQGEPFVGRAGQLLNSMLRAAGFRREDVFIANVLKCRPPGNRDPRPEEAAECLPYLHRQIALVAPRAVLCVGRIAAQNLLETDAALGKLRGRVHRLGANAVPVVVTYHPAYLLRSPGEKRKAWQDLKFVLEVLAHGDGAGRDPD
jgi:uracil-DNA glycosylase